MGKKNLEVSKGFCGVFVMIFTIAEVGSVFVKFATEEEAKAAKEALKGKVYDGREIKAIFIQEDVFKNELKL